MKPRPASTVLLLSEDCQVFMVQRHRKMGFLPNAWVFPGGRVAESDRLAEHPRVVGGERLIQELALPREEAVGYLLAAVRETFEETGIWLGDGQLPDALREPLDRGEVSLAEALESHDAIVDLDRLSAWSWWVTPEAEPKRYDTRFLVARADGLSGRHDERETVNSGWFDPATVLREGSHGGFPMAPPTWWTLYELAQHPDLASILTADRPMRPIEPIMVFEPSFAILLPGHPRHPEPAFPGLPTAVRFADGEWVAEGLA